MKLAYPCPVVFSNGDKAIASGSIASNASPLITTAFPLITQSSIVITDIDTYGNMVLLFDRSMVYVWKPKRTDPEPAVTPNPTSQVLFYEEGGWRRMLVEATDFAQRLNKTRVIVFGSKDLIKKILPFSYDIQWITIQDPKLKSSFENDAYLLPIPDDFIETGYFVTKKASYIVGPLLETNYGRTQPPKSIAEMWRAYCERTE